MNNRARPYFIDYIQIAVLRQGLFLFFGLILLMNMADLQAADWKLPSKKALEAALSKGAEVNPLLAELTPESFKKKGGYWYADLKKIKGTQVLVYQPKGAKHADIALLTPKMGLQDLFPLLSKSSAGKKLFSSMVLENVTSIIVSPAKVSTETGTTRVALKHLPGPVATAIGKADQKLDAIDLPTGFYLIAGMDGSKNRLLKEVFSFVGLPGKPAATIQMDGQSYLDFAEGKKGAFAFTTRLKRDNKINQLLMATALLKESSKGRAPRLRIEADSRSGAFGFTYTSPYRVFGKPVDTEMDMVFEKGTYQAELVVDMERLANPVLVPGLIEFNKVVAEGVTLELSIDKQKAATFVTPLFRAKKFTVKNKDTYKDVKIMLATTNGVTTGAAGMLSKKGTMDIGALARLADVTMAANPQAAHLPKWASASGLISTLKLDQLPEMKLTKPTVRFVTAGVKPGSNEMLDEIGIEGAGVSVKGGLVVLGQNMGSGRMKLDADGLSSRLATPARSIGPLRLDKGIIRVKASPKSLPSVKLKSSASFDAGKLGSLKLSSTEIVFKKSGFVWKQDTGCTPPMLNIELAARSFSNVKPSIEPSDCAGKVIGAIADAGEVAAKEVGKASVVAAKETIKAVGVAGKEVAKAGDAVASVADDFGCAMTDLFTGGGCSDEKREKAQKAAKKRMEKYRKKAQKYRQIEGPAHCKVGAYWNPYYQACWTHESKMFAFSGGKKSTFCLSGPKKHQGGTLMLQQCRGDWPQQFHFTEEGAFKNHFDTCVEAPLNGGSAKLTACTGKEEQRWELDKGQLLSASGLCLKPDRVAKGASLQSVACASEIASETQLVTLQEELNQLIDAHEQKLDQIGTKLNEAKTRAHRRMFRAERKKLRGAFQKKESELIQLMDDQAALLEKQRAAAQTGVPVVDWVAVNQQNDPYEVFMKEWGQEKGFQTNVSFRPDGKKIGVFSNDGHRVIRKMIRGRNLAKNSKNQAFRLAFVGKGDQLAIVSERSKMCVRPWRSKLELMGKQLFQFTCNWNASSKNFKWQNWLAVTPGDKKTDADTFKGKFMLKHVKTGLCLAPHSRESKEVGVFDYKPEIVKEAYYALSKCNKSEKAQMFKMKYNKAEAVTDVERK